jgi:hypothetical protein
VKFVDKTRTIMQNVQAQTSPLPIMQVIWGQENLPLLLSQSYNSWWVLLIIVGPYGSHIFKILIKLDFQCIEGVHIFRA